MTFADLALGYGTLDLDWQTEEAERIGNTAPALAHLLGDRFLLQAEFIDQAQIGFRLFDRIEIVALDVFDDGELELLLFGRIPYDDRDGLESDPLGRLETPLAGNELIALAFATDDERLQDPVFFDRQGKLLELGIIEVEARLVRIGDDFSNRDFQRTALAFAVSRFSRNRRKDSYWCRYALRGQGRH